MLRFTGDEWRNKNHTVNERGIYFLPSVLSMHRPRTRCHRTQISHCWPRLKTLSWYCLFCFLICNYISILRKPIVPRPAVSAFLSLALLVIVTFYEQNKRRRRWRRRRWWQWWWWRLCRRLLQRIEEHDASVQTLSQREDRDQYLTEITMMLGLRGHMYGELIRIQMMLAKDDPEMEVNTLPGFFHT